MYSTVCAVVLSVFAGVVWSENGSMETGWLELVKGSRDKESGTQVIDIQDGADTQTVTLAIPKKSVADRDEIEEVLVVGQMPEKPKQFKPIKFTYEWVSDYDSENYGLVIRLGKDTNWPIRLYMNSEPGYMR